MIRLTFVAVALQAATLAQGVPSIEGSWLGTLNTGATKLRIAVKVAKTGGGALSGTLDSLDQGAHDLPLGVEQQGTAVKFTLAKAGASYTGALGSGGAEIAGTWKQGGGSLPLAFHRVEKIPVLVRPQEPKKPYPYKEEEVSYDNKRGGSHLAGTLTLPTGAGPFPAALLITGSGQQDRDEALMGHKPFLVLADFLTRKGIAVLRVDDRGMGGSTGEVVNATSEDFAGDVEAGVEFLKSRGHQIDVHQIGLIGHSEGGMIAPMVAARTHDVAFVVMMAGTGVSGEEVSYAQAAAVARAMGAPETAITANEGVQRQILAIVKDESDPKIREGRLRTMAAVLSKRRPAGASAMANQLEMAASPWFRFFVMYDPAPALSKLTCPVLAMNGELDLQVIASLNLPAIVKALEAGGNKDYEIVKFPKLNHLFQTAKTGLPSEYSQIEETMAPVALETIANWILRHTVAHGGAARPNGGAVVVSP